VDTFAITLHIRKRISYKREEEIDTIAKNLGFHLSGFRSLKKMVSPEHRNQLQLRAQAAPL
jgi:hypothetical protein